MPRQESNMRTRFGKPLTDGAQRREAGERPPRAHRAKAKDAAVRKKRIALVVDAGPRYPGPRATRGARAVASSSAGLGQRAFAA